MEARNVVSRREMLIRSGTVLGGLVLLKGVEPPESFASILRGLQGVDVLIE